MVVRVVLLRQELDLHTIQEALLLTEAREQPQAEQGQAIIAVREVRHHLRLPLQIPIAAEQDRLTTEVPLPVQAQAQTVRQQADQTTTVVASHQTRAEALIAPDRQHAHHQADPTVADHQAARQEEVIRVEAVAEGAAVHHPVVVAAVVVEAADKKPN